MRGPGPPATGRPLGEKGTGKAGCGLGLRAHAGPGAAPTLPFSTHIGEPSPSIRSHGGTQTQTEQFQNWRVSTEPAAQGRQGPSGSLCPQTAFCVGAGGCGVLVSAWMLVTCVAVLQCHCHLSLFLFAFSFRVFTPFF